MRKPPTCYKSLTNFITYCCIEYTSPLAGFEVTTLVTIGTDCTGSCKSNHRTIMTIDHDLSLLNTCIRIMFKNGIKWQINYLQVSNCSIWGLIVGNKWMVGVAFYFIYSTCIYNKCIITLGYSDLVGNSHVWDDSKGK